MMISKNFFLGLFLLFFGINQAQVLIDETGASDSVPEESAILELQSADKGLLLPRLSQPPANPIPGLIYFDASQNCYKGYVNSTWVSLGGNCSAAGFYQNFDDLTNWAYTHSPETYNVDNDVWALVNNLSTISTLSNNFWGMRDIDNDNGGGPMVHTLTFDAIDLSGITNAVFSFDYESSNLNKNDEVYGYELIYDGVSQGEVIICDGCNTNIDGTVTISIPDTVNTFELVIFAKFDGANDIVAVDNFSVTF